jgi:hypothetical protein
VTSNRYVNETENQTPTTPRLRPEDAKDAAVGRASVPAFPTFTRLPPFLAFLASWR